MTEFTVKCPVIACTQTAHDTKSRGPLESDIVTVRDMSEIATENKSIRPTACTDCIAIQL